MTGVALLALVVGAWFVVALVTAALIGPHLARVSPTYRPPNEDEEP